MGRSAIAIVLASAIGTLFTCDAFPSGPPSNTCSSMAPDPSGTGHGADPQTTSAPYVVNVTAVGVGYASGATYHGLPVNLLSL